METLVKLAKLSAHSFKWAYFRLLSYIQNLGTIEISAIALIFFWFGNIFYVTQPLRNELKVLKSYADNIVEVRHVEPNPQTNSHKVPPGSPPINTLRESFLGFLPSAQKSKDQIKLLHNEIQQSGLIMNKIDYQYEANKSLPVDTLLMQLNMEGKQDNFDFFLHAILKAFPNLAINSVALERVADQQDTNIISFKISLYYRSDTENLGKN